MQRVMSLRHIFVEFIPDEMEDGMIYVSIPYATVAHRCCCGCGHEVITPLSPTDWTLIFDGQSISLDPSIGNWSFACQSHYWIRTNEAIWVRRWTQKEIKAGRAYNALAKDRFYAGVGASEVDGRGTGVGEVGDGNRPLSVWQKLRMWLLGANKHPTKTH